MPALITHQLSFQFDTGEWLFQNLNFTLPNGITGLVGRNGVGKSVFLSLLLGKLSPTQGSVTCQGQVAYYSQLPSKLLDGNTRISDYLGVTNKLLALRSIELGGCKQEHFDVIGDDWDIEIRLQQVLKTLRIESELNTYCHTLSGGQLALLQLYKLFESNAEILLLDEPSNHLDSAGKRWLINRLQQFEGQILLVSHDRSLLKHVDAIYQLTGLGLTFFSGNYDVYQEQVTTQSAALDRKIVQLKAEQKKIERQTQANKEKAQQREAQGNRLRKSGSQPKILMDAMKDKAGRSQSAQVTNQQNQVDRNQDKLHSLGVHKEALKPQALYLQQAAQVKKRKLLDVQNCRLHYGTGRLFSFSLSQTDRCYLDGANGCGKSTLLKAIQQQHSSYFGVIKRYTSTVYLDQNFGLLKCDDSMLDSLMHHCRGLIESDARILLAGIGFRRDSVYRKVADLSGGEKMKLSMLMVSHVDDAPLLLLDEPDNHLDIDSKQMLATALKAFKGGFILVSHDKDFVRDVGVNMQVTIG
ncbi:ATP-binding cassette domain-containing protein [Photobacterium indicum]|uniref:ABC transporter ATP-binding protein n=1 Tax=Photobacterium indicum TaxID=81447 RepID=A0A2T3L941_9GAMM|nr:ATP-binding cassette domain-containing protein [Photobacterium indicum]PSV47483.1 ABC transporter ATP-binding protein [Photobacterium indicum]